MTGTKTEQLQSALNDATSEGKPWAAFNDQPDRELHPFNLHFFASAGAAEQFCDEENKPYFSSEQVFNWGHYVYMQVAALKASLGLEARENLAIDIVKIARQMAEQSLYLPAGKSFDELEASLSQGLFYPVYSERHIDPLKEIADYHVIEHQHNGGLIYEIGHSHSVLGSFATYKDARSFMDNAVFHHELAEKGTDYLLSGRFHGQPLELDIEGYAIPHSGLTLITAHHNYQQGHDFYEVHSLFERVKISQYFFAGLHGGKLELYNDKLQRITVETAQLPFYPTYFKHDYLTFKNSNIMNEQSFDYVKNQLLYLGFGEDIAKPLREKMEQNQEEFTLPHLRKFGQDETNSVLHFSKGDKKDMTFLNRFEMTLKQTGKEDLTQTFFVGKEYNYTLQERYNMMDGRGAYREQPVMRPMEENGETKMKPTGETYFAWRVLNFKESDSFGNFMPKSLFWNHQKEVEKYPIKGIEENYDKERLLRQLEKGNKVDVTILKDGKEIPAKMVANPPMVRLDFYDSDGQSLMVRKVQKQVLKEPQKTEMTPQEVQREAIARAAEQKPDQVTGQQQPQGVINQHQSPAEQTPGPGQTQEQAQVQKESAKEQAIDQKQEPRRKQGIRL